MKTKFLFMLCSFFMLFFTLSSSGTENLSNQEHFIVQESKEINAVYNGSDESGYVFTIEENGKAGSVVFQKIESSVLDIFDLNSQDFVGVNFKVTYTTKVDESGSEVHTITNLEKL